MSPETTAQTPLIWNCRPHCKIPTLKLIQTFLFDRYQTVVLENEKSVTVPVTSGVPQGSVLGPILFLIYINDLPDTTKSKVRLFADDTAIYLAVPSLEDADILQQDFDQWELQLDMKVQLQSQAKYLLQGQVLESVAGSKYLGVEISNNLSFNNHI